MLGYMLKIPFWLSRWFTSVRLALGSLASALIFSLGLAACGSMDQPKSIRFVAAIEVTLRTPTDRADLIAILRRHASAGDLHVDDVSREVQQNASSLPTFARRTIYVGLWRGRADDDLEVSVDDAGHQGKAWVVFSRGAQPEIATRLRESLLNEILRRWPDARRVPVLPSGGLPSVEDLRPTPDGYKIVRSAASDYQLPAASPLLASD